MSLKLEIGKEYVTRKGLRVTITRKVTGHYAWQAEDDRGYVILYTDAGKFWPDGLEHHHDIVGPWEEPVIVTNTPWIKWAGTPRMPVAKDILVEVELRNGDYRKGPAENYHWGHSPQEHAYDIVAYRVVSNPPLDNMTEYADPYAALREVLDAAFRQSAEGKGKERHANEQPFTEQPIMTIGRAVGPGFTAGQVQKKIGEAIGMANRGEHDRAYHEALGAIIYAAATALLFKEAGRL